MFKRGSIENELMVSMERQLFANQIENKYSFNKLAKAIDCLDAAANIFDQAGMVKESNQVIKILQKVAAHQIIKKAATADDIEDALEALKKLDTLDISEQDLKNVFEASSIGVMAKIFNKLSEFIHDTKDSGMLDAIKNQLKEFDLSDPEKREEIKKDIAGKLATALKVLNIAKMFA
jgi:hypothetical protein